MRQNLRLAKPVTKEVLDAIRESVAAWLATPEGKESLRRAAEAVARDIAKLQAARNLDPEVLRRPFDI
ncbi:MAG: hypothetical protein HYY92_01425 [Parcubacteria group bacterium]|nr:hypothetical protein [Parcubacteria group bacterium]